MIAKKPTGESISANNGSAKFKSIDDIKDKRIGVLLGSVHDTYTMKNYPKATVLQYKSPPELVLAVKSGKVDAAMYTHETLLEILREEKELKLLGDTLFTIPIAMGFNQQNDALRESFNTFLQKIKEDGVFKDMVDRWLFKNITDMPVIKNSKTNGILTVGTVSDKGLPFTVVRNNIMIGFDIELAERFAAFLEKELKLVDMEFGSLIIAASTKKIDMIASTLMVTEERAKQIDFSLPYYRLGASVFTLKKNVASNDIKEKPVETVTFFDGIANSFHNNIIIEKTLFANTRRIKNDGDHINLIYHFWYTAGCIGMFNENVEKENTSCACKDIHIASAWYSGSGNFNDYFLRGIRFC